MRPSRLPWPVSANLGAVAVFLGAGTVGCERSSDFTRQRDANIQAQHPVALVGGYSDFHTLMADFDSGIVWFDYRLPPSVAPSDAATLIAEHVAKREPCFEVVEARPAERRLRCPSSGSPNFREYLIATIPHERRVAVMYADIEGEAEQTGYSVAVKDFRGDVESRHGRPGR